MLSPSFYVDRNQFGRFINLLFNGKKLHIKTLNRPTHCKALYINILTYRPTIQRVTGAIVGAHAAHATSFAASATTTTPP